MFTRTLCRIIAFVARIRTAVSEPPVNATQSCGPT